MISLLAGIDAGETRQLILDGDKEEKKGPYVAKAIPNVAARYRQSITILEQPIPVLPPKETNLLEWLFTQVGGIKYLTPQLVNVGTVLTTACLATLAIPLEGLLDGSVAQGLRRQDAMELVAQGVSGLATMLANGTHPAIMRESISSPRGCTSQTLLTVERASTRGVFAQALIDGTQHLQNLARNQK